MSKECTWVLVFFFFFFSYLRQMRRAPTEYLWRRWILKRMDPLVIVWNFPLEFEDGRVQKITAVLHKTTYIYIYLFRK